jgi:hypothetical protein
MQRLNRFFDWFSNYLSARKGMLPIIGILLVAINFVLQFFSIGWLAESNLLLHLGVILAIIGILLAWAL